MWKSEGISTECGKGGKPASWLSILCHFHRLLFRTVSWINSYPLPERCVAYATSCPSGFIAYQLVHCRFGINPDPAALASVCLEQSAFLGAYASFASKTFCRAGITAAFKTTFEVFPGVGPDNSLERLTERSVGLVTDQPSDVYELLLTLL